MIQKFVVLIFIFLAMYSLHAQETITRDSTFVRNDTVFVLKIVTIKEKVYVNEPVEENLRSEAVLNIPAANSFWSVFGTGSVSYSLDKISKCPLRCEFVDAYESAVINTINVSTGIGVQYAYNNWVGEVGLQYTAYRSVFISGMDRSTNLHGVLDTNLSIGRSFFNTSPTVRFIPTMGIRYSTTLNVMGSTIARTAPFNPIDIPDDFFEDNYFSGIAKLTVQLRLSPRVDLRVSPVYSIDLTSVVNNRYFINWRNTIGLQTGIQYRL